MKVVSIIIKGISNSLEIFSYHFITWLHILLQQSRKSGAGISKASHPPFSKRPKFVLAYAHRSIEYPLDSAISHNSKEPFLAATPAAWFSGYNTFKSNTSANS